MVDIHCHILHRIDDGATDFLTSVNMAKLAECNGTTAIAATPHCNIPDMHGECDVALIKSRVDQLNTELRAMGSGLTVYTGSEIFAAGDVAGMLKAGKLLTLNDSVYPLVEFDFYEHSASVYIKLQEICAEGFVPIIAHPERYAFVNEDDTAVERLKSMGCLIQVNKGSLSGKFGHKVSLTAHSILVKGQADLMASDAHSPVVRTPVLNDAYRLVGQLYTMDYAQLLFNINPTKVINNQKI